MSNRPPLSLWLQQNGPTVLEALPSAGLAYLLAESAVWPAPVLVVCPDEQHAERMYNDLTAVALKSSDVALFVHHGHSAFAGVSPDPLVVATGFALRQQILSGERPNLIVASAAAVANRWLPERSFQSATYICRTDEELSREVFSQQCLRCGYQPVNLVVDEGTFAVRGGILDIYPPGRARPIRLDLFGDEIASIKEFDPETQRTLNALDALSIYPIREVVFDGDTASTAIARLRALSEDQEVPTRLITRMVEEIEQHHYFYGIESLWPLFYPHTESVLDTLLASDSAVILSSANEVLQALEDFRDKSMADRQRTIEEHQPAIALELHLTPADEVWQRLGNHTKLQTLALADDRQHKPQPHHLHDWSELARDLATRREDPTKGEILDPLEKEIRRRLDKKYQVILACQSRGSAERLAELLRARRLDLPVYEGFPASGRQKSERAQIVVAPLSAGLWDEASRVAIITDVEIFGLQAKSRVRRRKKPPAEGLSNLRELQVGDYVVHTDFGVGRYVGLERLVLEGVDGDYVHLEYADGDKLFVPVYRLNVLQRYRAPKGVKTRLDKLGSNRWQRTKERVKDEVLALAHKMLALQARRQTIEDLHLPPPDDHFRAFEATFPFDETPDQHKAIQAVIEDLTRGPPMDRLICGDVGFGKTEVAVRAAFLSVLAGKQVAVLVPTTVLAEQHGRTFRERLAKEGVNIEVLSRFRTAKETSQLLAGTRQGTVDILIGTHRMLSADVAFNNLGLLVVDEEQRFGVKHKERIKQLKSNIHVLTLSATPIPRTLHMAMVGIRDLSIIQTPPAERTAIHTEVTRFDETLITEAIRRELHRGGQVYVVHNRVQSIASMADLVRRLVPEARVVTAHGQMSTARLEKIMVEFVRREHNVLVCTAIIESGIDIPSANTMIINRADAFGLSQLHQLRGRIGRSRERAHAYLLLPRSSQITKDATARLAVLKQFSQLGSGFQIASQDLDIRGAGELLGASQSGQIAAVGYELFTELLAEAVERAKGEGPKQEVEPDIKLPVTAVLPEDYISAPMHRLEYYQRMATAESDEAVFDVCSELKDVYGDPPEEVMHLAEVMVIRRRLQALGASYLSGAQQDDCLKIGLNFVPEAFIDRSALAMRIQRQPERFALLPSGRLAITWPLPRSLSSLDMLRTVRHLLSEIPVLGKRRRNVAELSPPRHTPPL